MGRGGKAKTTTSPKKKATKKETKKEVALSPSPAKKKRRVTAKASPPKKKQKKETTKVAAGMKHSVGTKIAKKFKRDIYYGTIKSVDAKNKWYHVVYDDGDEEDFEDDEIDKSLVKNDDAVGGKKKTRGKKK